MLDWKKKIQDVNFRLKELATRTPDTIKGAVLLAGAGATTGHLDAKMRELIALAVAVTTRCDGCIAAHSAEAVKLGATDDEIAEALGVAINLNAGAALVHSAYVLDAVDSFKRTQPQPKEVSHA